MSVTVGRVGGGALLRQRDRIPEGWSTPSSGSSGPGVEEAMDKLVGGSCGCGRPGCILHVSGVKKGTRYAAKLH